MSFLEHDEYVGVFLLLGSLPDIGDVKCRKL